MRLPFLTFCVALALPVARPAPAHPHVFIDAGFALVVEGNMITSVRIEWTYDAFYSLLMIEEYDLDTDRDGVPDPDRLAALAGHDVDWAAGFPGDFSLTVDGHDVSLAPPVDHAAAFRDDRVITSHVRPLAAPVPVGAQAIVARAYDPGYFVAYDVPETPGVIGRDDCHFLRDKADTGAAQAEFGDRLAAVDQSEDPFDVIDLADIGILFADSFTLDCGGAE